MNSFLWNINFSLFNLFRLIPNNLINIIKHPPSPIHILFCMVDHFEPGTGNVSFAVERERMKKLLQKFPKIAERHRDSYNNHPKRTWFFPPHYHRNNNLKELVSLSEAGYGEIELHLHHGKQKPDTSENLKKTIEQCVEEYSVFGIFGRENGGKKYAFIHGNSALDNSRGGKYCGVNNEIQILKDTGCFADFTFPCFCESNPFQINSIFYAIDNSYKPKSYNFGIPVKRNRINSNGLMIIQGPIYPYLKKDKIWGLRLYGPAIDGNPPVDEKRIDAWIKTGIHIEGNDSWIIVKTHTHGAVESEAVLGDEMNYIYDYLEQKYADSENFFLHYVTARELFNIVKAAEAGEPLNNPEVYRNYCIEEPHYDASPDIPNASKYLKSLVEKTYL